MSTGNRGTKFFEGKQFQLKGRMFHCALLAPKWNKEKTKESYGSMFAWKPEENPQVTQAMLQLMDQAKQQFHPQVPVQHWVNPVKHFNTTQRRDGKPHPEYLRGHHWLNASANLRFAPKVIIQDPSSPTGIRQLGPQDAALVYSGRNAVISVSFWLLDGQNLGVSCNLDGMLLLEGGEQVASDMGIDPSQAFSSFLGNLGYQQPQQGHQQYQQPAPPQHNYHTAGNAPMNGAPAANGQTQYPQTGTAYPGAQGQPYAPNAYPSNGGTFQNQPNMPWNNGQGNNGGGLV